MSGGNFAYEWSKKDTHCALCGKENAGEAEWQRSHDDAEHTDDCWCLAYCWQSCGFEIAEDELVRLRGLAEAQAAVIARYKAGWRRRPYAPETRCSWWHYGFTPLKSEPMTPAEQQVIYGEVEL